MLAAPQVQRLCKASVKSPSQQVQHNSLNFIVQINWQNVLEQRQRAQLDVQVENSKGQVNSSIQLVAVSVVQHLLSDFVNIGVK